MIIIDDPFRPGEEDTPEYRAKIKWWFTVDMAMPKGGIFVGVDPGYSPDGKYGCSACHSQGFIDNGCLPALPYHDPHVIRDNRCRRCSGTGIYVSRARAGLSDL